MARINILNEILKWSLNRPSWQRDALRRLITKGELEDLDINELSSHCKSQHGLAERTKSMPLEANHLPQPDSENKPVSLKSLTHTTGVNALAQDQTIEFGDKLTVVFGENAAGKSGYTRILKRACRARGAEEVLGNVVSGAYPERPSAIIMFTTGCEFHKHIWADDQPPHLHLSKVSVFDHHCASVYITERTDVAFRPMGLDILDKLSDCSEAVRKILEMERNSLASQKLNLPDVVEGTAVHELLAVLTSLTNPDKVRQLATITNIEEERWKELMRRIRDLESNNPERTARTIEFRIRRAEALIKKIESTQNILSETPVSKLFGERDRMSETQRLVEELHRVTFHEQPLPNTGSDAWRTLWNAAERFSTVDAYPSQKFPFTESDALCVLCQQQLTKEGISRLELFQTFLSSSVQEEYETAARGYDEKCSLIRDLQITDDTVREALNEIHTDNIELSESVRTYLNIMESLRTNLCEALSANLPKPEITHPPFLSVQTLINYIENLRDRIRVLREENQQEEVLKLRTELNELEARLILREHLHDVLNEIERKKKLAAYIVCIDETRTNAITRKSSDVTKRAVTEQLTKSFADELIHLKFDHVEVQMMEAGGSRGVLYHKLQFRRAPSVEVSKVVSEGEARCLSIASFFAELSTADDRSAILFDDPVSSLDHNWRTKVANRLVFEAKSRQVIVFTHDIVFLLTLVGEAEKLGVELKHQYLRRGSGGVVGLSSQGLPWAAMKVNMRIGRLNEYLQNATTIFNSGEIEKYEWEASKIYGLLREAWERGLEEVLLDGTVERYRKSIQTKQIANLSDINMDDCEILNSGMTKCSTWLTGHDVAPAENEPFPNPTELKEDINMFEDWVKRIRKRRI